MTSLWRRLVLRADEWLTTYIRKAVPAAHHIGQSITPDRDPSLVDELHALSALPLLLGVPADPMRAGPSHPVRPDHVRPGMAGVGVMSANGPQRAVADLTFADLGEPILIVGGTAGWLYEIRDRYADGYPGRTLILVTNEDGDWTECEFTDSDPSGYPKTMGTLVERWER